MKVCGYTNLYSNPSFEGDSFLPTSSPVSLSTEWSASGTRSVRITSPGTGSSDIFADLSYLARDIFGGITAPTDFTILAKARIDTPLSGVEDTNRYRNIYLYHAGPASFYYSPSVPNTTGVHEIRYKVTLTRTPTFFRLYSGHSIGSIWWDDLLVIKGDYDGPYFDGNSANAEWTGTPHASTSVLKEFVDAPTKVYDGSTWQDATIKRYDGTNWITT